MIELLESERDILVDRLKEFIEYQLGCARTNRRLAEKARAGAYSYLKQAKDIAWLSEQSQKVQDDWDISVANENNPEWWLARANEHQIRADKYTVRLAYFRSLMAE